MFKRLFPGVFRDTDSPAADFQKPEESSKSEVADKVKGAVKKEWLKAFAAGNIEMPGTRAAINSKLALALLEDPNLDVEEFKISELTPVQASGLLSLALKKHGEAGIEVTVRPRQDIDIEFPIDTSMLESQWNGSRADAVRIFSKLGKFEQTDTEGLKSFLKSEKASKVRALLKAVNSILSLEANQLALIGPYRESFTKKNPQIQQIRTGIYQSLLGQLKTYDGLDMNDPENLEIYNAYYDELKRDLIL